MRAFKGILLTGTAILALVACSSDKGPGEIGSLDDIVVRNAGEKSALPPPGREPVKEVKIAEAATEGDTAAPSAAELIAAEDTGTTKVVEDTAAAAQEAQEKAIAAQAEATPAPAEEAAAPAPDTAPSVAWNQPRRIDSPEEADKLVEEQMAQSAPPAATEAAPVMDAPAEPAPAAAEAAPAPAPATAAATTAPAPLIPVTPPESYTQDPDAPYSPAAARAAAAAQTGTPSDAPVAAPASVMTTASAEAAPAPMTLSKVDGPMPLDAAVLQSKDPASIKSLQKTLADAGYYKGALNGEMNSDTLNAYVKYQTAAQAASAQAAPAPTPVAEAPAAPTPVMEETPVMAAEPVMAPAPAPEPMGLSETPVAMDAKVASPRPLVSRRTPRELPPVEPMKMTNDSMSAAPSTMPAPTPTPTAAPAPAPMMGATVSMTDPAVITAVQKALSAKGLYSGTANGTMDADTLNAVIRYQAANNLTPGPLNIDTLKSLGVVAQ